MEKMKSLADQIREQLLKPAASLEGKNKPAKHEKTVQPKELPPILLALTAYDTTTNKNMVHARFDEKTVRTMNQFKMATGIEVTRLVSFAVKTLFDTYPEFKTTIKQFIQNNEL